MLISASILALIAGATVGLASNAVNTAVLGANRSTANQLAQEGVELVRQMRDTTYIDGQPNRWNQQPGVANTEFPDCSLTTSPCGLKQDTSTGNWTLVSGTETLPLAAGTGITQFTRIIQLKQIPWYTCAGTGGPAGSTATNCTGGVPNDPSTSSNPATSSTIAMQVLSTVSWFQNGRKIDATASTFLSDWRPTQ